MNRAGLLLALVMACGGDAASTTAQTDETTVATPSGAETTTTPRLSTTRVEGITATAASTTTTAEVEVELDDYRQFASVVEEFETRPGWRYRVLVFFVYEDPNASTGECIEAAPPRFTNLTFTLSIENLLTDRPAPTPDLVFASNLGSEGLPILGVDPFDPDPIGQRIGKIEVMPNAADTYCILASGLTDDAGYIGPGESGTHYVAVGPIQADQIPDLVMGLRLFTGNGEWIELTFTTEADSGVINPDSTGI
jgi:hypothetical protein